MYDMTVYQLCRKLHGAKRSLSLIALLFEILLREVVLARNASRQIWEMHNLNVRQTWRGYANKV